MEAESTSPENKTSNTVAPDGGDTSSLTSDTSPQNPASTDSLNDDTNTRDRTDISADEVVDHSIKCNCVEEQHENASPSDTESVISMASSLQSFTILLDSPQTSNQRKCCLKQRLWSVFNNEHLSDVMFIVGQDEQQKEIPAHRVILAVASDVFKATFSRTESGVTPKTTYHVPDVAPAAFMALLRFFYLDEVLITSDTVISTLYAARKYAVQSLEDHCVNFLIKNLCLDNAVTILNQVMMFNIKRLINACLEMIEGDTIAAVAAEGFANIDAKTLRLLLERDSLTISEIQLFQAVLRWSEAECLRENLTVDQENQRSVLKDALPLLRFPLMTVEEFSSTVTRSGLLTKDELLSMYLYFTEKPKPAVSFNTTPRFWEKVSVNRFQKFEFGCACSNTLNDIDFSCNRDILLLGLGLFGSANKSGKYDLKIQLKNTATDFPLRDECKDLQFENVTLMYKALFDEPVKLKAFTKYTASVTINGPDCFIGKEGLKDITVPLSHNRDAIITFHTHVDKEVPNPITGVDQGQIPLLIFIA